MRGGAISLINIRAINMLNNTFEKNKVHFNTELDIN